MHIAILGNGISGVTTARFLRKQDDNCKITIISSESEYFYSRTALMYIYMGHMREVDTQPYEPYFWTKNRIDLKKGHVEQVDFKGKELRFRDGNKMSYDKLVLATGSASNYFGWSGQDLDGVRGLYNLQDLQYIEERTPNIKRAVIVGGGLIGIELAEMFHSRHIPVTFLVREDSFWNKVMPPEESEMISRHILEHKIDLRLGVNLEEIIDDGTGKVKAVKIKETGEVLECQFVGLTAGVHPNIDFLKGSDLAIERGIVVNDHLETNQKDVYAIGDCAQLSNPRPGRRPVEAIWYTGKMMGETVAYNIMGKKIAYDPGLWFNSAKFLDIEYQVYGEVTAERQDHQTWLYWEHADGKKSIRIVYHNKSGNVLGFNLMGVRYRHEVCEEWIKNKISIEAVLTNLGAANFDPEFYKEFEADVVQKYNKQANKNLTLKTKRGLAKALAFFK